MVYFCWQFCLSVSVKSYTAVTAFSHLAFKTITTTRDRSFGDRSFGAAGPRIWNSLPCGLRTLDISYKHFKTLQKTYMC